MELDTLEMKYIKITFKSEGNSFPGLIFCFYIELKKLMPVHFFIHAVETISFVDDFFSNLNE